MIARMSSPRFIFLRALLLCCCLGVFVVPAANAQNFLVGVCTHMGQERGAAGQTLALLTRAGIGSFRDEVYWGQVEKRRGHLAFPNQLGELERVIESAHARGVEPLLILDYGNVSYDGGGYPQTEEAIEAFARYAEFVVEHFKGRVRYYEIWNEWNGGIGVDKRFRTATARQASSYLPLLKKVYPRIKAIDPSITVLGGAVAPAPGYRQWVMDLMELGGGSYMDGLSLHQYVFDKDPSNPEQLAQWLQSLHADIGSRPNGRDLPIYITEVGWPTHFGQNRTSPDLAAAYLSRLFFSLRTLDFVKGIWWYDLRDDGSDPLNFEDNFGLVDNAYSPKPTYKTLALVAPLISDSQGAKAVVQGSVWAVRVRGQAHGDTIALWSLGNPVSAVIQTRASKDGSLFIQSTSQPVDQENQSAIRAGLTPIRVNVSAPFPTLLRFLDNQVEIESLTLGK
jgi:hypothetical protein